MMKIRGSITVFLLLSIICIFSALFALLEAARAHSLKASAQMYTLQAKDAVLASYQRDLWSDYHLLFWQEDDMSSLSGLEFLQQEIVSANRAESILGKKNYFLCGVSLSEVTADDYLLATDSHGAPFRAQAVRQMKQSVGELALQTVLDLMKESEEDLSDTDAVRQKEADALNVLENMENRAESSADEIADASAARQAVSENPIQWMKKAKNSGIFAYLMPEETVSDKIADLSESVSRRSLLAGTLSYDYDESETDRLLFHLYLGSHFLCVTDSADEEEEDEHDLDYEMEYLIAGRDSDKSNLSTVVNRLLLMREAANLAYLETDSEKCAAALAVGATLTTALGQPELAEIAKQAILAAWAYAESLSDVRILLEGGKVSLIKTADQWHTSIENLSTSATSQDGKEQQKGLNYETYLQILLWTAAEDNISSRALDLIELNTGTKMDQMLCRVNCSYSYEAPSVFWNFVMIGGSTLSSYRFSDEAEIYYQ